MQDDAIQEFRAALKQGDVVAYRRVGVMPTQVQQWKWGRATVVGRDGQWIDVDSGYMVSTVRDVDIAPLDDEHKHLIRVTQLIELMLDLAAAPPDKMPHILDEVADLHVWLLIGGIEA